MELLDRLTESGLQVKLAGDNLVCGPLHLLTDERRALIRANKAELILALRQRLTECPLWQAGLICHVHSEGRCNHEPSACSVANGMRNYIHKHRMILTVEGKESS